MVNDHYAYKSGLLAGGITNALIVLRCPRTGNPEKDLAEIREILEHSLRTAGPQAIYATSGKITPLDPLPA